MTDKARLVLLPCPFCGADVTVGCTRKARGVLPATYQVECDCGAVAGPHYTTEDAAAKIWNRRAAAPSLPEPDTAVNAELVDRIIKAVTADQIERYGIVLPDVREVLDDMPRLVNDFAQLRALADQARDFLLCNQALNACKRQLELQQRIGRDECCLNAIQRCIDDVQKLLKDDDK